MLFEQNKLEHKHTLIHISMGATQTDRQTDRQSDERMDRQTDTFYMARRVTVSARKFTLADNNVVRDL